jgi:hypothetical protein
MVAALLGEEDDLRTLAPQLMDDMASLPLLGKDQR